MYALIVKLLTWIDPDIMQSLKEVDKVQKVISREEQKA